MARCVIVEGEERAVALGRELRRLGHAVRLTVRDPAQLAALEADGFDAVGADPDRIGTIYPALEGAGLLYVLLGSAPEPPLHAERLEMLLLRALDGTVRGIAYEAAGSAPAELLREGADRVERFCGYSHIPFRLLQAGPADPQAWLTEAAGAAGALLS